MPQINWKLDFSFGNVITIATLLLGLIIGWQTVVSDVRANTRDIVLMQERLKFAEVRFEQYQTAGQVERVRQTELLTELRTDLRYLRETLNELTTNQRDMQKRVKP